MSESLAAVSGVSERLMAATTLTSGIRQASELDSKHHALARLRGAPAMMHGIFETLRPFDRCGSHYQVGTLLSRDLLPDGALARVQLGKTIRLVAAANVAEMVA